MKRIFLIFIMVITILSLTSCSHPNDVVYQTEQINESVAYTRPKQESAATSHTSSVTQPVRKKVNTQRALTLEEGTALKGTGYHNTEPNSVAESIEIKAAMVKCKECGMHSDNGENSLCDECRYNQEHGLN